MAKSYCLISPILMAHEFSNLMGSARDCRVMRYYDIGTDSFHVLWLADGRVVKGENFANHDLTLSMDDFSEKFIKPVVAQFQAGLGEEMPIAVAHQYADQLCPSFCCTVLKANHG
jgi:hypothetical protein